MKPTTRRIMVACSASITLGLIPGCSTDPTSPPGVSPDALSRFAAAGKTTAPVDPTTTWKLPLDDAGLNVKSDRKFSDGLYSVYANGVCGVSGSLFLSGSGDATLNASNPQRSGADRTCSDSPRQFTVVYGDGVTEAAGFINLHSLQTTTSSIPVSATQPRFFGFATGRCEKLQFGNGTLGDSVLVTRVDAHTWRVASRATPDDRAYCVANAQTYHMQIDLVVVSSRDVP